MGCLLREAISKTDTKVKFEPFTNALTLISSSLNLQIIFNDEECRVLRKESKQIELTKVRKIIGIINGRYVYGSLT